MAESTTALTSRANSTASGAIRPVGAILRRVRSAVSRAVRLSNMNLGKMRQTFVVEQTVSNVGDTYLP